MAHENHLSDTDIGAGWGLSFGLGIVATWWLFSMLSPAPAQTAPRAAAIAPTASNAVKPATVKAAKGPFKVEVSLSGVFEAKRLAEVSIRPKTWTMPLVVDSAIELGKPVKKGDVLVELDREKIDKAIQDAEVENTLTELALQHATEELPILEKSLPVELAAAERARTYADEDLKNFVEIDRPLAERIGPLHGQAILRVARVLTRRAAPAREDVPIQRPDRRDRRDHPPASAVPDRDVRVLPQAG